MVDAGTVTAVMSALGVGSLVGTYVTVNKDRRASRAAVLQKIQQVELERWAPVNWLKLRAYSSELSAAALVAQLPRSVVAEYLALAHAAAGLSQDNADERPDDEYSGGVNSQIADLASQSARLMTAVTWAPGPLAGLHAWLGLRRLREALGTLGHLDSFGSRLIASRKSSAY